MKLVKINHQPFKIQICKQSLKVNKALRTNLNSKALDSEMVAVKTKIGRLKIYRNIATILLGISSLCYGLCMDSLKVAAAKDTFLALFKNISAGGFLAYFSVIWYKSVDDLDELKQKCHTLEIKKKHTRTV